MSNTSASLSSRSAHQAMTIAIVFVLPVPGRHLDRQAGNGVVPGRMDGRKPFPDFLVGGPAETRSRFHEPDDRFRRLQLAEEGAFIQLFARPVVQKPTRRARHARPSAPPPTGNLLADSVDQPMRFEPRRGRPRRLFPRERRREIGAARPPPLDDLVRSPEALVELPVARRLLVWTVQDRRRRSVRRGSGFRWQGQGSVRPGDGSRGRRAKPGIETGLCGVAWRRSSFPQVITSRRELRRTQHGDPQPDGLRDLRSR